MRIYLIAQGPCDTRGQTRRRMWQDQYETAHALLSVMPYWSGYIPPQDLNYHVFGILCPDDQNRLTLALYAIIIEAVAVGTSTGGMSRFSLTWCAFHASNAHQKEKQCVGMYGLILYIYIYGREDSSQQQANVHSRWQAFVSSCKNRACVSNNNHSCFC